MTLDCSKMHMNTYCFNEGMYAVYDVYFTMGIGLDSVDHEKT